MKKLAVLYGPIYAQGTTRLKVGNEQYQRRQHSNKNPTGAITICVQREEGSVASFLLASKSAEHRARRVKNVTRLQGKPINRC